MSIKVIGFKNFLFWKIIEVEAESYQEFFGRGKNGEKKLFWVEKGQKFSFKMPRRTRPKLNQVVPCLCLMKFAKKFLHSKNL